MEVRKTTLFCVIAALHAALLWQAWRTILLIRTRPEFDGLELLHLLPPSSAVGTQVPAATRTTTAPSASSIFRRRPPTAPAASPDAAPAANAAAATDAAAAQAGPPPQFQNPSGTDWDREAQDVARDRSQLAALPKPRPLDGRERGEAGRRKAPEQPQFGWDHVHIQRVETLPEGGILVWLNDRCAIVFAPLPFGGCGIGTKPARGDLFDHMRDMATDPAAPAP